MKKKVLFIALVILMFSACGIEPQPIEYGKDMCNFCKMNIVDQQHAAEIVSKKGKVYKYDAIECMLNELKSRNEAEIALFLVNTYDLPKELADAATVNYLISEAIKSPMGANLSAFKDKKIAISTKEEKGGDIYNWEELKIKFSKD